MSLSRYHLVLFITFIFILLSFKSDNWGFYGHRKINEMAIYTLPPDMFGFFKKHGSFLSDHAVDPDMRRYSSKFEAIRHYIDIDHWGENPFDHVPKYFDEALIKFGAFSYLKGVDTTLIFIDLSKKDSIKIGYGNSEKSFWYRDFKKLFNATFMRGYYDDNMQILASSMNDSLSFNLFPDEGDIVFQDNFSEYGICPYNLYSMYFRLVKAFKEEEKSKLLNLLADFGHYVADAHVPLHTTENYNGQLTGQDGIHAFWESRIVELYDNEFDFLVGKAEYINDVNSYIWSFVEESYNLVDSVLTIEKRLRKSYPSDRQYCYDERLSNTLRIECPEFARAYMVEMDGMVESRMIESVHALGSLWYTAWVDAGQPELLDLGDIIYTTEEAKIDEKVKASARIHE